MLRTKNGLNGFNGKNSRRVLLPFDPFNPFNPFNPYPACSCPTRQAVLPGYDQHSRQV
jgi:hypothetical protein